MTTPNNGRQVIGRLLLVLGVGLLASVTLAGVAQRPAQAQEGSLRLLRQTAYVPAEGVFEAELEWTGEFSDDLAVSVLIHTPIAGESDVVSNPTGVLNRTPPVAITDLPSNGQTIQISIPIKAISAPDARIWLREAGVYPVTIEVRGSEGTVASLRSNLVRLPNDVAEIDPLPVAFILGVSAAEDITIADATGLLTLHPDLPITVQLDDGALTQLATDVDIADGFRTALGDRPVLVSPAFDLDPSALAEIGQPGLYLTAVQRTDDLLASLELRSVPNTIAFDSELTEGGVQLLGQAGITTVVRSDVGSSGGGQITATTGAIRIIEADVGLTNQLAAGPLAISNTHDLLATLAIRQSQESTPVVLGGVGATSLGLGAAEAFFAAATSSGLMQPVSLATSAELTPLLPLRAAERPTQDLGTVATELGSVTALLNTYGEFHVSGGLHPVTAENNILTSLSRERNPEDRSRALVAARATLEDALAPIELPEGQSITLAARRSVIPITVSNSADGPRQVRLRFTSRKVEVDEQDMIRTLAPGTNTLEINVEARSLGLSPLEVEVLTPDSSLNLASTTFQIRSTAVPGLGLVLSGAALGVLLIWWVTNASNRRKREREEPTDPTTATNTGSVQE